MKLKITADSTKKVRYIIKIKTSSNLYAQQPKHLVPKCRIVAEINRGFRKGQETHDVAK